jgi:ankyrin repeat protein
MASSTPSAPEIHVDVADFFQKTATSIEDGHQVLRCLEACANTRDDCAQKTKHDCVQEALWLVYHGADISVLNSRGNALSNAAFAGLDELVAVIIGRMHCRGSIEQINYQNSNGCSALMFAANRGFSKVVALLLSSGALTHLTDKEGGTASHRARTKGFADVVDMIENFKSHAALNYARVQVSVYRLFVMSHMRLDAFVSAMRVNDVWWRGLDAEVLNATAPYQRSQSPALNVAIINRNAAIIMSLLRAGADASVTVRDVDFQVEANLIFCMIFSMMWRKAPEDNLAVRQIFKLLVHYGADVNAKMHLAANSYFARLIGVASVSPLMLTIFMFESRCGIKLASSSAVLMLQMLIEAGADVNEIISKDGTNVSPLLMFFHLQFLMDDAAFNSKQTKSALKHQDSLSSRAGVFTDIVSVFRMMISAGCRVNLEHPTGDLFGGLSVGRQMLLMFVLFFLRMKSNDSNANVPGADIHLAAARQSCSVEILRMLIDAGADLSERMTLQAESGRICAPALATALCCGNIEVIKMMIAAGADVNSTVTNVEEALDIPLLGYAIQNCSFEVLRLLIEAGADVNSKFTQKRGDKTADVPVWFKILDAVGKDDDYRIDGIRAVIAEGADVNIFSKNFEGDCFPPLKLAIDYGISPLIQLLIESHADVNATINRVDGFQSLCSYAVETGKLESFQILSRFGSNLNVFSKFLGFQATPLGTAIKKCNFCMVRLLLEANADISHVLKEEVGGMDLSALECVQKTIGDLKSSDTVKLKQCHEIRAIVLQHQQSLTFLPEKSRNFYEFFVRSAHGNGTVCFNFEIDSFDSGTCTISELKCRIQSEALHQLHIPLLVIPSKLILVYKGCIAAESSKLSDIFSSNVKSNITAVVISGAYHVAQHEATNHELEERRRYVTVQLTLQDLRTKMSAAEKRGLQTEYNQLCLRVRQIQLDNPSPDWILRDRLQRMTEHRSARAKVQLKIENGLLEEARQLQSEIVGQCHTAGHNDVELCSSLMTLSEILVAQGKLDDAQSICVKVLNERKRLHGETHPDTLQAMGFYAGLLIEMRKLNEAEKLLALWLKSSQQLLGSGHPQTIACKHALQYFHQAHDVIRSGYAPSDNPEFVHGDDGCPEQNSTSQDIKRLCDSGYKLLHVLQCLAASDSDPQLAERYLADGLPDHVQKQYVYGHLISKMWTQACLDFVSTAQAPREVLLPSMVSQGSSVARSILPSSSVVPINLDARTQWVCDQGVVRPKCVVYSECCPKGSALLPVSCLQHGCFSCGVQGGISGFKCDGCCPYGICEKCLTQLRQHEDCSVARQEFPVLGVSISFLKSFKERWAPVYTRWSTSQVVKMIIKPLTSISKKSLCDDLIEAQSSDVSEATVFLSHVWNESFADTMDAFLEVAESWRQSESSNVYVWIDVFSASQHTSPDELPSSWWIAVFKQAIAKMGHLVMVMQPWAEPVALTRGWCILELFSCVSTGGRFEIALPPSERTQFFQRDPAHRASFFQKLPELMNSRYSKFSRDEDKLRILGDIESTVGFAAIDSTLLRAVESWYVPQFQLLAASASAFLNCGLMQADAFFQLAHLQYIRGDYAAAVAAALHALELLDNIKSSASSQSVLSQQCNRIIQTRLLLMNSFHMQGEFKKARVHHFLLLHCLKKGTDTEFVPSYDEQTGMSISDAEFHCTKSHRIYKKYLECLQRAKEPQADICSGSHEDAWGGLEYHATYPYCALGIPAELTASEDLSSAWGAAQELCQEQSSIIAASAVALLQADDFLHSLALREYMSNFCGRYDYFKVQTWCCYQGVAGPLMTVMQVVWPQCSENIKGKDHKTFQKARFSLMNANHCLSHESIEPVNRFCSKICSKTSAQEPSSQIVTAFDSCNHCDFISDADLFNCSHSATGSECSGNAHDLGQFFDENDQVVSCHLHDVENALFSAAEGGFTDFIRALLERKADVNANDQTMRRRGTPLHVAVASGHSVVVRLLIEGRADVNSVSQLQDPPLHTACDNGHLLIASLLIDAKADVNQCAVICGHVVAPIFRAAGFRSNYDPDFRDPIIRLLIEAKADVNAYLKQEPFDICGQQEDAFGAADCRVEEEWEGVPRRHFIVRQKRDVSDEGEPVWYKGTRCFYVNSGNHRISARPAGRADVMLKHNLSILHWSVVEKQPRLCSLLIGANADLNALASFQEEQPPLALDISMCSPLAAAVLFESVDCIRLLIEAKSDPNTRVLMRVADESNLETSVSISEFALEHANQQVVQLLLDAQANPIPRH